MFQFAFHPSTIHSNRKCSKVVGTPWDIFGDIQKSSENGLKSSEVAWMFSEIPVMTKRKSVIGGVQYSLSVSRDLHVAMKIFNRLINKPKWLF